MKTLSKLDMKKLAKQLLEMNQGLYRLTAKDVSNIEMALRVQIEACQEKDDHRGAAVWKRTWNKFK